MRAMKDSGIEWIGKIPEEWDVKKLKTFADVMRGGSPRPIEQYLTDRNDGLNWIKIGDTIKGSKYITSTKQKIIKEGLIKTRLVHKGDLLLTNSMSFGEPYILDIDGCIHDGWVSFANISSNLNKEYLYYVLGSKFCSEQFLCQVDGGVVKNLNIDKVGATQILIPPYSEQQRIADFLDAKCADIDTAISEAKASIEDYKLLKQSIITKAVTKGLNPNAEMKDSGIEWIGKVPKEWKIRRGKFVLKYLEKSVKETDGVITCFRDGEVTLRSNRREDGFTMSEKEIGYQGIDVGDLVVHGMDGFAGAIGISDSRGKGSPVLNVLDSEQNKKYIMYYLRNLAYRDIFIALSTGIRVRSCDLRWNKLANLPYLLPSIDEQNEIVSYVDDKCTKINTLVSEKEQIISELEAYKKSLIFEYVTGKKEVA